MPIPETVEGISDDILKQAGDFIKELLKNKKLPQHVRAQLEVQSYFLMILTADHEKMSQVYPFFKEQIRSRQKWNQWWDKLQWILVPLILTSAAGFVANAVSAIFTLYQKINP